jgi:hypothetical protein
VSPLEKKGIREERDNGIKTARLFITLGRGRCVIFFFLFFLFFALFYLIFHFADTRRRRELEILDGGQTFSFLAIFI